MPDYQYSKCHFRDFFQPAVMTILKTTSFLLASKSKALLIFFLILHSPHPSQLSTCQRNVQEKVNLGNMQHVFKNPLAFK